MNCETYHQVKAAKVAIRANKLAELNTGGYSMFPFIEPHTKVQIEHCEIENLQIGDIIAFEKRQKMILHRLVSIQKDGIVCQGDSCRKNDGYIPFQKILGRVSSIESNNQFIPIDKYKPRLNTMMIRFGKQLRPWHAIVVRLLQLTQTFQKHKRQLSEGFTLISSNYRKQIRFGMALSIVQGILPLLLLFFIKLLIEQLSKLSTAETVQMPWFEFSLVVFTFIVQSMVQLRSNSHREHLSMNIAQEMYTRLHAKHTNLPMWYLEDATWQNKIHQAAYEIRYRPMQMINHLFALAQSLSGALLVVVMILWVRWWIIPIIAFALIPEFIIRFWHARKQYALKKKNLPNERKAMYYSRILTGSGFAKELRLFDTSNYFGARFDAKQKELNDENRALLNRHTRLEYCAQAFGIILVFLTFAVVVNLSIQGILSLGTVVFVFFLMQRGFNVLKSLTQTVSQLFEDSVFMEDFLSFIHLPEKKGKTIHNLSITEGITLDHVSLKYNSSKREALHDVSLTIKAGEKIAIVGHNGSGKTTLIKLLCGLYTPTKGALIFDDQRINDNNRQEIKDQTTTVFQDFALYNLTVSENIALGDIHQRIDMNRIEAAIKFAGLTEVIEKLPGSYHCKLGNMFMDGEELSFGQWQRLAIARAYYRDRSLVLMDEPSSALDPQAEQGILHRLQALGQDKTLIIVSHRLHAIQWVDRIVVMNKGQVDAIGTHQELLESSIIYQQLYRGE